MKYILFKFLIMSVIYLLFISCSSNKKKDSNKIQESELDKREQAFEELYNEHH